MWKHLFLVQVSQQKTASRWQNNPIVWFWFTQRSNLMGMWFTLCNWAWTKWRSVPMIFHANLHQFAGQGGKPCQDSWCLALEIAGCLWRHKTMFLVTDAQLTSLTFKTPFLRTIDVLVTGLDANRVFSRSRHDTRKSEICTLFAQRIITHGYNEGYFDSFVPWFWPTFIFTGIIPSSRKFNTLSWISQWQWEKRV